MLNQRLPFPGALWARIVSTSRWHYNQTIALAQVAAQDPAEMRDPEIRNQASSTSRIQPSFRTALEPATNRANPQSFRTALEPAANQPSFRTALEPAANLQPISRPSEPPGRKNKKKESSKKQEQENSRKTDQAMNSRLTRSKN